jgi:hypothetical protein
VYDYYVSQSKTTDPGEYAHLFDEMPDSVEGISEMVSNLIYHYFGDKHVYGWEIPQERLCEIDSRDVSTMLSLLLSYDNRPLTEARDPKNRVMGCCRDFSTLFVSIARHKGIPARTRYGFATYFEAGVYVDHVVAEIWNGKRWQLIDPELNDKRIQSFKIAGIDPMDLQKGEFLNGAEAWLLAKQSHIDSDCFCVSTTNKNPATRGLHFVVSHLVQDVAALNKVDSLCWDWWGFDMYDPDTSNFIAPTPEQVTQLDEAAQIVLSNDLDRIQRLFRQEPFTPTRVWSWSPAIPDDQKPLEISLHLHGQSRA